MGDYFTPLGREFHKSRRYNKYTFLILGFKDLDLKYYKLVGVLTPGVTFFNTKYVNKK